MDKLPEALLLQILSRLDDSVDVARCRLACSTFDTLSRELRSIHLQCLLKRYDKLRSEVSDSSSSSQHVTPFKTIFRNLISNLRAVESVYVGTEKPLPNVSYDHIEDDLYITDGDFVKEWLPRVSEQLKSLSISDFPVQSSGRRSDLLPLVSAYCHNLVELEVKNAWLSVDNLNPMPMLTSLTLESIKLDDEHLNELNKCFPNLKVLSLIGVGGLKIPKIQLLNLKTCHWTLSNTPSSITVIAPNLISLTLEFTMTIALNVEAPMLSHFHLTLDHAHKITFKRFENLKTLWLESLCIGCLLCKFPLTETVENLTLHSRKPAGGPVHSNFTLRAFLNMGSLCINSSAWSELEVRYRPERGGNWDGLETLCAYLLLVDPLLTLSSIGYLLSDFMGLSNVSLLIHRDVGVDVLKSFICRCMDQWPRVNWRWGLWKEGMEDCWVTSVSELLDDDDDDDDIHK